LEPRFGANIPLAKVGKNTEDTSYMRKKTIRRYRLSETNLSIPKTAKNGGEEKKK